LIQDIFQLFADQFMNLSVRIFSMDANNDEKVPFN
jgi:hypothetical protein